MTFALSGSGDLTLSCVDFLLSQVPSQVPGPAEVHLFWMEPREDGRDLAAIQTWLSPSERERVARIQHPRALAEFTAGRRMMRQVLGGLLGVAPQDVLLQEGEKGALHLDPRYGSELRFNLSHTPGLVVLAVAKADIGVDVEWVERGGRTVEIAERYFAPKELQALRELSPQAQRERFFELWTLKEAYIKARGLGLAIPLKSFAYSGFDERAIRIEVQPHASDRPDWAWHFWLGWMGPVHRLALALGT